MPSTGFYLFLHTNTKENNRPCTVSMPSTGFYLFLRKKEIMRRTDIMKCQCPQRASTYFFDPEIFFKGLENTTVSMPSTGFYLFLLMKKTTVRTNKNRVNALNGLLLISSLQSEHWLELQQLCVNALNGLLLISSMPEIIKWNTDK